MKKYFGTNSWTEIDKRVAMPRLGEGLAGLQALALERTHGIETALA